VQEATCLQNRHLPRTISHWVQKGVLCPFSQRSVAQRFAARQAAPPAISLASQKFPVTNPQSTQGLQSIACVPAAKT
jgi:hypothetical protein